MPVADARACLTLNSVALARRLNSPCRARTPFVVLSRFLGAGIIAVLGLTAPWRRRVKRELPC